MSKAKDNTTRPWERQPRESHQAFEAFSTYLNMGSERSYTKVGRQLGKSKDLIDRWGRDWNWQERIRAYDNDLARQAHDQAAREVVEMQKRQIKIAMMIQQKAAEALKEMPTKEMTLHEVARSVDIATKIERLNRGEATERTEGTTEHRGNITVESNPFEELTAQELREYIKHARTNNG